MTRIVVPSALSSRSSVRISSPVWVSRLPVGSSAKTIAGRAATAPAIRERLARARRVGAPRAPHQAGGGASGRPHDLQQRLLAEPGGPDNGRELAGLHGKV